MRWESRPKFAGGRKNAALAEFYAKCVPSLGEKMIDDNISVCYCMISLHKYLPSSYIITIRQGTKTVVNSLYTPGESPYLVLSILHRPVINDGVARHRNSGGQTTTTPIPYQYGGTSSPYSVLCGQLCRFSIPPIRQSHAQHDKPSLLA